LTNDFATALKLQSGISVSATEENRPESYGYLKWRGMISDLVELKPLF